MNGYEGYSGVPPTLPAGFLTGDDGRTPMGATPARDLITTLPEYYDPRYRCQQSFYTVSGLAINAFVVQQERRSFPIRAISWDNPTAGAYYVWVGALRFYIPASSYSWRLLSVPVDTYSVTVAVAPGSTTLTLDLTYHEAVPVGIIN